LFTLARDFIVAAKKEASASMTGLFTLVTLALVLAAFYFAKEILLPLSLAVLLSFVLTPLVRQLERLRIGRVASVLIVTVLTFSMIGGVALMATNQVVELSTELPKYKDNLITKIRSVRGRTSQKLEKAKEALEDIGEELAEGGNEEQTKTANANALATNWLPWLNTEPAKKRNDKASAVEVKVVALPPSPLNQIQGWLGPLVAPLSTTGIVVVLVIFMLVKREDLRNRFIQLFGTSQLYATTEAIDDATCRLSRYLRMQFLINTIYGFTVAGGLMAIGVPNAVLWGVFGMLLRFLPYIGPWIAASMPIALSLAVSDGWQSPLMTIGLFITLELLVNNVLEPWLYGSSTGVSSFGVILAAIFWTWLWGPVGLVLAMPLTVCLVVMGKYVPQLSFLPVLLGDRSTLAPHEQLYQRMLTSGDLEATTLVEEYLESSTLINLFDEVLIPALHLAEHDRHAGLLSDDQEAEVIDSARELVEELGIHAPVPSDQIEQATEERNLASGRILCVPVRDQADETAGIMLGQMLSNEGFTVELGALGQLAGETVDRLKEGAFNAVVLSVLPPLGSRNGRYLCKRIRRQYGNLPIIVALYGGKKLKKTQMRLIDSGATTVTTNLADTISVLRRGNVSHSLPAPHWDADTTADTATESAATRATVENPDLALGKASGG